jgi:hypothetical protein
MDGHPATTHGENPAAKSFVKRNLNVLNKCAASRSAERRERS